MVKFDLDFLVRILFLTAPLALGGAVLNSSYFENDLIHKAFYLFFFGFLSLNMALLVYQWRNLFKLFNSWQIPNWLLLAWAFINVLLLTSGFGRIQIGVALLASTGFGLLAASQGDLTKNLETFGKGLLLLVLWCVSAIVVEAHFDTIWQYFIAALYGLMLLWAISISDQGRSNTVFYLTTCVLLVGNSIAYFQIEHFHTFSGLFSNPAFLIYLSLFAVFPLGVNLFDHQLKATSVAKFLICLTLIYFVYRQPSATAFIILLALAVLFPLVLLMRRTPRLAIYCLLALSATECLIGWLFSDRVLGFLYSRGNMEARLEIWTNLVSTDFAFSSFTGAGLGQFWNRIDGPWTQTQLPINAFHAHNGFLELWLELGTIGLFLFSIAVFVACLRVFTWSKTGRLSNIGLMAVLFAIALLITNLAETFLLPNSGPLMIYWSVFIWLLFSCIRSTSTKLERDPVKRNVF